MLDSVALEAIDKAWLDARERSVINPVINHVIMEGLDTIGKKYNDNPSIKTLIYTHMISIDGFH